MPERVSTLTDTFTLSNGVEIPKVGFGTWQIPDGDAAYDATTTALTTGYRHVDSARAYGNEASVARAVRDSGPDLRGNLSRQRVAVGTVHHDGQVCVRSGHRNFPGSGYFRQSTFRIGYGPMSTDTTPLSSTPRTSLRRHHERGMSDREALYEVLDAGLICHLGVVAGGGTTLLRAKVKVDQLVGDLVGDEATGARIVAHALQEPLKQIARNAGLEGGVVVDRVLSMSGSSEGLNAATGNYEDLTKAGIIDAAKVTRSALQNAASIAALFLTTEAVIADQPEKGAGGGMPGGMDDY